MRYSYVMRIDTNEFDHENGIDMIQFPNSMEALDFAAEVAESIDPTLWEEARYEFEPTDYREAIDRFNDLSLAMGGEIVKLFTGNNSREYMLRKD